MVNKVEKKRKKWMNKVGDENILESGDWFISYCGMPLMVILFRSHNNTFSHSE